MNEKRIVHEFGIIIFGEITSMATTFDNKILFVCSKNSDFREFDISTHNEVNTFEVKSPTLCVVTYDNQFLIITEGRFNCNLTKWSIQTKQKLHTWARNVDLYVMS